MFAPPSSYGRNIEIGRLLFRFHFQQLDIALEHANVMETTGSIMKRKIRFSVLKTKLSRRGGENV